MYCLQSKLTEREERLKNITASIRKREEARKEPGVGSPPQLVCVCVCACGWVGGCVRGACVDVCLRVWVCMFV